jgi:hypothetical protein
MFDCIHGSFSKKIFLAVMNILKWITGFISSYLLVELTGGSNFLNG